MAGSSTTWTRWDCRHQHCATLQGRTHTTSPASVRYTNAMGTWTCWTPQHAVGFMTCSVNILNQTQENDCSLCAISYPWLAAAKFPSILWGAVHLPTNFTVLLAIDWHLDSVGGWRDLCSIAACLSPGFSRRLARSLQCCSLFVSWIQSEVGEISAVLQLVCLMDSVEVGEISVVLQLACLLDSVGGWRDLCSVAACLSPGFRRRLARSLQYCSLFVSWIQSEVGEISAVLQLVCLLDSVGGWRDLCSIAACLSPGFSRRLARSLQCCSLFVSWIQSEVGEISAVLQLVCLLDSVGGWRDLCSVAACLSPGFSRRLARSLQCCSLFVSWIQSEVGEISAVLQLVCLLDSVGGWRDLCSIAACLSPGFSRRLARSLQCCSLFVSWIQSEVGEISAVLQLVCLLDSVGGWRDLCSIAACLSPGFSRRLARSLQYCSLFVSWIQSEVGEISAVLQLVCLLDSVGGWRDLCSIAACLSPGFSRRLTRSLQYCSLFVSWIQSEVGEISAVLQLVCLLDSVGGWRDLCSIAACLSPGFSRRLARSLQYCSLFVSWIQSEVGEISAVLQLVCLLDSVGGWRDLCSVAACLSPGFSRRLARSLQCCSLFVSCLSGFSRRLARSLQYCSLFVSWIQSEVGEISAVLQLVCLLDSVGGWRDLCSIAACLSPGFSRRLARSLQCCSLFVSWIQSEVDEISAVLQLVCLLDSVGGWRDLCSVAACLSPGFSRRLARSLQYCSLFVSWIQSEVGEISAVLQLVCLLDSVGGWRDLCSVAACLSRQQDSVNLVVYFYHLGRGMLLFGHLVWVERVTRMERLDNFHAEKQMRRKTTEACMQIQNLLRWTRSFCRQLSLHSIYTDSNVFFGFFQSHRMFWFLCNAHQ